MQKLSFGNKITQVFALPLPLSINDDYKGATSSGRAQKTPHERNSVVRHGFESLVADAELVLQLPRRHAVGMRRHEMRGPEPHHQRQLGTMHHRSGRGRGLSAAVEAFVRVSATLQRRGATLATAGTNETIAPTPLQQETAQLASSGNVS